jgi:hypothetical protein
MHRILHYNNNVEKENISPTTVSFLDSIEHDNSFLISDDSTTIDSQSNNTNENVQNEDCANHTFDAEYMVGIELLALLQHAKCPLYMFDKIMNWARKANAYYKHHFQYCENGINRQNILKSLTMNLKK